MPTRSYLERHSGQTTPPRHVGVRATPRGEGAASCDTPKGAQELTQEHLTPTSSKVDTNDQEGCQEAPAAQAWERLSAATAC